MMPLLRNELVFDRHSTLSQRSALESLKREAIELELQIRQLQVSNSSSSSSSAHTSPLSLPPCRTPLMHWIARRRAAWRGNCTTRSTSCRRICPWRSLICAPSKYTSLPYELRWVCVMHLCGEKRQLAETWTLFTIKFDWGSLKHGLQARAPVAEREWRVTEKEWKSKSEEKEWKRKREEKEWKRKSKISSVKEGEGDREWKSKSSLNSAPSKYTTLPVEFLCVCVEKR